MNIGKQGLDLIKQFEGLKLKAYKCPAGVWTIGYGHTKTVKPNLVITEAEATKLLLKDLAWVEAAVDQHVTSPINQQQYDALCSFTYNVGATALKRSTLVRLLNAGDYEGAAAQFKRWNKAGGKTLRGLTRRREAERALFVSKTDAPTPAPTRGALEALLAALVAIFKNRGA